MSVIADLPDIRPSLLLDFANSRKVHPLIQCTRASTATCYGPDGKLRAVANNVPRMDYDPMTGKCLGVLAEEARTNLLLQSGDLSASPWSGSTTDSGDTEASLDGVMVRGWSKSAALANKQQSLAGVAAGAVSISFAGWNKGRTGVVSFGITDLSGASLHLRASIDTTTGTITKHTDSVSAVVTAVLTNGVALVQVRMTNPASGIRLYLYPGKFDVVDSTVSFFSMAQVEVGAFPTSYMPTTATAQTRAADMLSMVVPQIPSDGYTICVEASINWVGEYPVILSDNSTGLGNYVGIRAAAAGSYINSAEGGRSGIASPRPAAGAPFKMAAAISNDASKGLIAVDGVLSTVTSARTSADLSLRNILKLGAVTGAAQGVNLIRRVAMYPRALTGAQLQRLTT